MDDISPVARLLARTKLDKQTGCLLWTGAVNKSGYAQVRRNGAVVSAHRVALELSGVPVKANDLVLHQCDVRHCINPQHLRVGTHLENVRDAVARKRYPYGTKVLSAKLDEDKVRTIKQWSKTHSQRKLAEIFGVCKWTISQILTGKAWKHVQE